MIRSSFILMQIMSLKKTARDMQTTVDGHFCHHFMVNITYNPTVILFCFHAPPMGHSFNPFLHHPLIPPLDQQMSCHFTDFHPSLFNRFHLAG